MTAPAGLYALLIGVNQYECAAVRWLRFAVADVVAFRRLLQDRMELDQRNCMLLSHPATGSGAIPRRTDVEDVGYASAYPTPECDVDTLNHNSALAQ